LKPFSISLQQLINIRPCNLELERVTEVCSFWGHNVVFVTASQYSEAHVTTGKGRILGAGD